MWRGPTSPKPLSQKGRSPMKVAQTSTSSTDTLPRRIPGASGHTPDRTDADRAPFAAASHTRIPTAPRGPVSMTRAQVTAQLAQADADGPHERTTYESVVLGYGAIHAHGAF